MICPQESKQHMIALVQEMRDIMIGLPGKSFEERKKVAERMKEIRKEMVDFRRKYPDA